MTKHTPKKFRLSGPNEYGNYITESQGHTNETFRFNPGVSRCGGIHDGVTFEHGNEGGWVVSFAALEQMYLLAKERRAAIAKATGENV